MPGKLSQGKFRKNLELYNLQCSNCNAIYYDEIERHLKVRTDYRTNMSTLTGKRVKGKICS